MCANLKAELKKVNSAEKRLKSLVAQWEDQALAWEERSERACALREEDLAREALARRSECLHERQELLARLSQVETIRRRLEDELKEAIKKDSKNTVMRVAEEIKTVQQELKQAREADNALLASILAEKIEALLGLGREAWKTAFPDEASSYETPSGNSGADSFGRPLVDPYSKEIDVELENLRRRTDGFSSRSFVDDPYGKGIDVELEYIRRSIDRL